MGRTGIGNVPVDEVVEMVKRSSEKKEKKERAQHR